MVCTISWGLLFYLIKCRGLVPDLCDLINLFVIAMTSSRPPDTDLQVAQTGEPAATVHEMEWKTVQVQQQWTFTLASNTAETSTGIEMEPLSNQTSRDTSFNDQSGRSSPRADVTRRPESIHPCYSREHSRSRQSSFDAGAGS